MVQVTPSGIWEPDVPGSIIGPFRGKPLKINAITHPDHITLSPMWLKWRLSYIGGEDFKRTFLKRFSAREDQDAFYERRIMTYVPAFAKTGIDEIRNSIFQRLTDICRESTSQSYLRSCNGLDGGVDRRGSTMEFFLGTEVLTELLIMGKVGVYVDNPNIHVTNYAQSSKIKPYLYIYKAEQIRSWTQDDHGQLLTLLLEDVNYDFDKDYQLPIATTKRYRFYWIDQNGYVNVQFYDELGVQTDEQVNLKIKEIPFHILYISSSLMTDICDYQIALLNMASSDIQFARLVNYPLYVEQFDFATDLTNQLRSGTRADEHPLTDGSAAKSNIAARIEKIGGNLVGRRIQKGLEYPQWISPSPGALEASMAKQEQMKAEIQTLLHLGLGNLQGDTKLTEGAKNADISKEEKGLSYIGFELSKAESKICQYWQAYENNTQPFYIKYPQNFDVKTTEDRLNEATSYMKLLQVVPSITYKRELLKKIAKAVLGHLSFDCMKQIYTEIDSLTVIVDPAQLLLDLEARLVTHKLASKLEGYPPEEAELASKEAINHATEIMKAQTPTPVAGAIENPAARGVPELSADPKADIETDRNKNQPYKSRGKGKANNDAQD